MRIPHNVVGQVRAKKQPQAYLSGAASPGAFGVGVAQSVQGFGESLGQFGEELQRQRDQLNDFKARKAFIDESAALQQDFHERKLNAPLGAPNFTQQTLNGYQERSRTLLDDLRQEGLSQDQLQDLELNLSRVHQSYTGQALNFEVKQHTAKVGFEVEDVGTKLSQVVQTDPYEVEAAIVAYDETIDSIPGIDATTREEFRQKGRELFSLTAGLSLAEQEPGTVRELLRPSGNLTADGFVQKMKTSVAAVESGGREKPYRAMGRVLDSGDRAYGKYQIMGANIPQWTKDVTGTAATPTEFLADPALQEAVFEYQMQRLFQKHGNMRDAASVWFTGVPFEQAVREGRHDGNLSVQEYVAKVENAPGGTLMEGETGDPVLDRLNGPQRLRVLNAADSNFNKIRSDARAQLEVQVANAEAAWAAGGHEEYRGPMPGREDFYTAYGELAGEQRWKAFQGAERVGDFVREMGSLSDSEIQAKVNSVRPTDTSSPTFAVEQELFTAAQEAAERTMAAREEDSADYVARNYPAVQEAMVVALESGEASDRQLVFAEMEEAYEQLNIHPVDRRAFSEAMLKDVRHRLSSASPEAKVAELVRMRQEMGDLFYTGLEQMDKSGLHKEAYVAGLTATSPGHQTVAANALRGVQLMEENKSLTPNWSEVNTEFRALMGQAQLSLPAENVQAVNELAAGLYVFSGGDPKELDVDLFDASVRQVLGGTAAEDTGIVDLSQGYADVKTILPSNITEGEFTRFISGATDETWESLGGTPMYSNSEVATAEEIADEGVFVRVGAEDYQIMMGSDGLPLQNENGEAYTVRLPTNYVKRSAALNPARGIIDSLFGG